MKWQTTGASSYYELNVLEYGADPSGKKDSSEAFQKAVDDAATFQYSRIFVPLANGQMYFFQNTVRISKPNFQIIGDGPPNAQLYGGNPPNGFITCREDLPCIFYFGGGEADKRSGAITLMGLVFYLPWPATEKTIPAAIRLAADNNGPHRAITIQQCSAFGFQHFLHIQSATPNFVVAGFLNITDCNFNGCMHSVYSPNLTTAFHYSRNQSEHGARIQGKFGSRVVISENNLEGQTNPIDILSDESPSIHIHGNYVEANEGDYLMRISGRGQESTLLEIGPQSSLDFCKSNDLFLIEGRCILLQSASNRGNAMFMQHTDGQWHRRKSMFTLNPQNTIYAPNGPFIAIASPGSDLDGKGFYVNVNALDTEHHFCYACLKPDAYPNTQNAFQEIQFAEIAGTEQGMPVLSKSMSVAICKQHTPTYSFDIHPAKHLYRIISFVFQWDAIPDGVRQGVYPIFIIQDQHGNDIARLKALLWTSEQAYTWHLVVAPIQIKTDTTSLRVTMEWYNESMGNTETILRLAGIAVATPLDEDIEYWKASAYAQSKNEIKRLYVRPFLPFV